MKTFEITLNELITENEYLLNQIIELNGEMVKKVKLLAKLEAAV